MLLKQTALIMNSFPKPCFFFLPYKYCINTFLSGDISTEHFFFQGFLLTGDSTVDLAYKQSISQWLKHTSTVYSNGVYCYAHIFVFTWCLWQDSEAASIKMLSSSCNTWLLHVRVLYCQNQLNIIVRVSTHTWIVIGVKLDIWEEMAAKLLLFKFWVGEQTSDSLL